MADENLKYIISARDTASKTVRRLRKELQKLGGPGMVRSQNEIKKLTRQINQLSGGAKKGSIFFSRFTKGIALGNLAAMAAVKGLALLKAGIDEIAEATKVAARLEVLQGVMELTGERAGFSAEQLEIAQNKIRDLGIAQTETLAIMQRFIQAELQLADATKLARLAQDAAVIAGINSSEAALAMTDAVNKLRPVLLKQFGIMVDLRTAFRKYAEANDLAADSLTAAQKKQALMNAVLEQGKTIAGAYETAMEKVGKQMTSLPRFVQDLQIAIGEKLLPVMQGLVFLAEAVLKSMTLAFSTDIIRGIKDTTTVGQDFSDMMKTLKDNVLLAGLFLRGAGFGIVAFGQAVDAAISTGRAFVDILIAIGQAAKGNIVSAIFTLTDMVDRVEQDWTQVTNALTESGKNLAVAWGLATTEMGEKLLDYINKLQDAQKETREVGRITKQTATQVASSLELIIAKARKNKTAMAALNDATKIFGKNLSQVTITAQKTGNVAVQAFNRSASSARGFIDALSSGEGQLRTFLRLMSNILNFIPGGGVFGAVAGGLGALFDDPVNDMNLVKETRRIGAFVARGIAQAIPDFSPSDRFDSSAGQGVTNIMNVQITSTATPLQIAEALEDLSVDGFTTLAVTNG